MSQSSRPVPRPPKPVPDPAPKPAPRSAPKAAAYFNASVISPVEKYVAWVDVMGSRARLTRSLKQAANFVGKLHVALISAETDRVSLHPMNDGAFVLADSTDELKALLRDVFSSVCDENEKTNDVNHYFMPRAGIAFGPVVVGSALAGASRVLDLNEGYRDTLLLGAPIVQAFESESRTGPFGVYVHDTARTLGPQPWSQGAYMRYWKQGPKGMTDLGSKILAQVDEYLLWAAAHSAEYDYAVDAIAKHRSLAYEFLNP